MTTLKRKNIGGFFELEIGTTLNAFYHSDAIALTSGRSCLSLILATLKPTKIYLPYYICDDALIPLKLNGISYEFYAIDEHLIPTKIISLRDNEYIMYVNYFGLMNQVIDNLYVHYGARLIVDNTQAFFAKKYNDCWSFNSARKFFGVPDGGYLYAPHAISFVAQRNANIYQAHLIERLLNKPSAYASYLISEANIEWQILQMSLTAEKILATIDYAAVIQRRQCNFVVYERAFGSINKLKINFAKTAIPFCYPLWLDIEIPRNILSQQGVFVPTLWQDTLNRHVPNFCLEKALSLQLLPLPIDHRYDEDDCHRVMQTIEKIYTKSYVL